MIKSSIKNSTHKLRLAAVLAASLAVLTCQSGFAQVVFPGATTQYSTNPNFTPNVFQRAGQLPSIKDFGAQGNLQVYYNMFTISASSTTLSAVAPPTLTTSAAITASTTAQTVSVTSGPSPSQDVSWKMVCDTSANQETITVTGYTITPASISAVFTKSHASGISCINTIFSASSIGNRVGVGGAGNGSAKWYSGPPGYVGYVSTSSWTDIGASITMNGANTSDTTIDFDAFVNGGNSVDWRIDGSSSSSFTTFTTVYGANTVCPMDGVASACSTHQTWNSRDRVTLTSPTFAYYRVMAKDTASGSHGEIFVNYNRMGSVLQGTITAYTDPWTVTISVPAVHSVTGLPGYFGADDTAAFQAALKNVPLGTHGFETTKLLLPAGRYLLRAPLIDTLVSFFGMGSAFQVGASLWWEPGTTPQTYTTAVEGIPTHFYFMHGHPWNQITGNYPPDYGSYPSFGIPIEHVQFECGEQKVTCYLSETIQEDSSLNGVSVNDWNSEYGILLTGYAVQNWHFNNVSSAGGWSSRPAPMRYLGSAITSTGSQTVTILPSTTGLSTSTPIDLGWMTPNLERNVAITAVVDSTHVTIAPAKTHSLYDAVHPYFQPIAARVTTSPSSNEWDKGTLIPVCTFCTGTGLGLYSDSNIWHALHFESAMCGAFFPGGIINATGMNAITPVLTGICNYSANQFNFKAVTGNLERATYYDGVNDVWNFSYEANESGTDSVDRWSARGVNGQFQVGVSTTNPSGVLNVGSTAARITNLQFSYANPPSYFPWGPLYIGQDISTFRYRLESTCNGEYILSFSASIDNGSTWSDACGGTNFAPLAIGANGDVFAKRLTFGNAPSVNGYNIPHTLGFGYPYSTYPYQWLADGAGGAIMHFQWSNNFGASSNDAWTVNAGNNGLMTVAHLATPNATASDSPVGMVSGEIGNISLLNFAKYLAGGVTMGTGCCIQWDGTEFAQTTPPTLAAPLLSNEPLFWNSGTWGYYAPGGLIAYMGPSGVTPATNKPLNWTGTALDVMSLSNFITFAYGANTANSGSPVKYDGTQFANWTLANAITFLWGANTATSAQLVEYDGTQLKSFPRASTMNYLGGGSTPTSNQPLIWNGTSLTTVGGGISGTVTASGTCSFTVVDGVITAKTGC